MMKKNKNKIGRKKGFTLIETMIGLTILTIAIVTATSLLIGLIQSNRHITKSLQAYYLAQEGLEAVRNIRDTNWMNNRDWEKGISEGEFVIGLDSEKVLEIEDFDNDTIFLCGSEGGNQYFSTSCHNDKIDTGFKRKIEISKPDYCSTNSEGGAENSTENNSPETEELCKDEKAMLVTSTVSFDKGEVVLEMILTDWKGGAL
ncbi:MAG: type II secretion system protein [Candidatus Gracilibacteria bacterium]|nr:type II secretion system protein [Candidatus Gracilibacteria bacterium]